MTEYFTIDPAKLAEYQSWIDAAKNVVITTHQNPDGDAFGSSLALYSYFSNFGFKNLNVISPTEYADFLAWMPHVEKVVVYENRHKTHAQNLLKTADIIFCLDFSSGNRVKDMSQDLLDSPAKKIIIDHHENPEKWADAIFWNQKASSTCELIYQMINELGDQNKIDLNAAKCIYTGLLTDTGSFRFDATTPEVHLIVAELLKLGVKPNEIYRSLFDNNTYDRLKLLGYFLDQKMQYLPEYRVCYFSISEEELKSFNSKNGDTEGIVNYGLSIKDVVLSAIFIEKDGLIRISFRSVDDFSASDLARDYFEGGGHKNAAGAKSDQSLEDTVQKFLNLLPNYKSQLMLQPN